MVSENTLRVSRVLDSYYQPWFGQLIHKSIRLRHAPGGTIKQPHEYPEDLVGELLKLVADASEDDVKADEIDGFDKNPREEPPTRQEQIKNALYGAFDKRCMDTDMDYSGYILTIEDIFQARRSLKSNTTGRCVSVSTPYGKRAIGEIVDTKYRLRYRDGKEIPPSKWPRPLRVGLVAVIEATMHEQKKDVIRDFLSMLIEARQRTPRVDMRDFEYILAKDSENMQLCVTMEERDVCELESLNYNIRWPQLFRNTRTKAAHGGANATQNSSAPQITAQASSDGSGPTAVSHQPQSQPRATPQTIAATQSVSNTPPAMDSPGRLVDATTRTEGLSGTSKVDTTLAARSQATGSWGEDQKQAYVPCSPFRQTQEMDTATVTTGEDGSQSMDVDAQPAASPEKEVQLLENAQPDRAQYPTFVQQQSPTQDIPEDVVMTDDFESTTHEACIVDVKQPAIQETENSSDGHHVLPAYSFSSGAGAFSHTAGTSPVQHSPPQSSADNGNIHASDGAVIASDTKARSDAPSTALAKSAPSTIVVTPPSPPPHRDILTSQTITTADIPIETPPALQPIAAPAMSNTRCDDELEVGEGEVEDPSTSSPHQTAAVPVSAEQHIVHGNGVALANGDEPGPEDSLPLEEVTPIGNALAPRPESHESGMVSDKKRRLSSDHAQDKRPKLAKHRSALDGTIWGYVETPSGRQLRCRSNCDVWDAINFTLSAYDGAMTRCAERVMSDLEDYNETNKSGKTSIQITGIKFQFEQIDNGNGPAACKAIGYQYAMSLKNSKCVWPTSYLPSRIYANPANWKGSPLPALRELNVRHLANAVAKYNEIVLSECSDNGPYYTDLEVKFETDPTTGKRTTTGYEFVDEQGKTMEQIIATQGPSGNNMDVEYEDPNKERVLEFNKKGELAEKWRNAERDARVRRKKEEIHDELREQTRQELGLSSADRIPHIRDICLSSEAWDRVFRMKELWRIERGSSLY